MVSHAETETTPDVHTFIANKKINITLDKRAED